MKAHQRFLQACKDMSNGILYSHSLYGEEKSRVSFQRGREALWDLVKEGYLTSTDYSCLNYEFNRKIKYIKSPLDLILWENAYKSLKEK